MAVELAPRPVPLPLLLVPDKPERGQVGTFGWRWKAGTKPPILERRPQDDEHGAIVQWMVVRYYRDGVLRKELADEYGYSERRVQEYLSGFKRPGSRALWWIAYSAPVIRALRRLGFPVDERSNRRKRVEARVTACQAALAGVADLLADDARPAARRLRCDIALLSAAVPS